jgi:redox-sensitive bicupin YhaK (pirin superfamily)
MITNRPSELRGHFNFGWLDTRHTFSFGGYVDPLEMGFKALRVLNEDRVQPGRGFGTHGHQDMEILTWVLAGALEHRDSLGTHGVIRPGEAQVMSAGTGIRHSEFNASGSEPVHFLQIWILPEKAGLAPRYDQKSFEDSALRNRLQQIACRSESLNSVQMFQDIIVYASRLDAGQEVQPTLAPGRSGYLHLATGSIQLNGHPMQPGDGARIEGESRLRVEALEPAEILFFDLA